MDKIRYVIEGPFISTEYFTASNDSKAEKYVEENYSTYGGTITLYRLSHVCSLPKVTRK